jgi:hypothetical protein
MSLRKKFFYLLFLISCSSVSRNLWLNRFEVCCVVNQKLQRNNQIVELKDRYFEDDYLKLNCNFDVMKGFTLNITNKCGVNSYINWDNSCYIDENGFKKKVIFYEMSFNDKLDKKISIFPPFMEIPINIHISDNVYKDKNVWNIKPLFDFSKNPQDYLFKKVYLIFNYMCGDNNFEYLLEFEVDKRYKNSSL